MQTQWDMAIDHTPLYDILPTKYGGRGAFARQSISKGTPILSCAGPYAHVIFWEFRREACAWCFAYSFESGRSKWSVKLADHERAGGTGGVWFCSSDCRSDYIREHEIYEGHGLEWRTEINIVVEKMLAHKKRLEEQPSALAHLETLSSAAITPEFLDEVWADAAKRSGKKAAWTEELSDIEFDSARFVLDGLLRKIAEEANLAKTTFDRLSPDAIGYCVSAGRWADYLTLQDNEYELMRRNPSKLASHIRVYRFLRHLTTTMLPPARDSLDQTALDIISRLRRNLESPSDTRVLLGRDSGNVFGIWDMATDEGSEMLGWGAFVFASFFNHNCEPNLKKRRNKRGFEFYALKDIAAGEEICISYSDGVSVHERMRQLESGWFFICQCAKCAEDWKLASSSAMNRSALV